MDKNLRYEFEKMRPELIEKKGTICCNCLQDCKENIIFHHIVPLAIGGTNNFTNIAPVCEKCDGLIHNINRTNWKQLQREGIEKAKLEGKYNGRTRLQIDEGLMKSVCQEWREGKITAKKAMEIMNLKPNTFYRRVKEWNL